MAIVYRHIRLDKNEPFYIGIGVTEKRAYQTLQRNKFWKNIVAKTDYEVEILFDDLTDEEAKTKEVEFIKLYGRKDLGTGCLVNMTDGGDGTLNPSIEKREQHTLFLTGKKHSDETKLKMGIAQQKRFQLNPVSKDSKRRMSEAQKTKTYRPSDETKQKISLGGKGLKRSEETKRRISEARIGKKFPRSSTF